MSSSHTDDTMERPVGPAAVEADVRRLRAVFLPPVSWQPERDRHRPGSGPDPLALDRHLAARGIDAVLIDPGRRPLNPFSGRGSLLQSLDPLRALRVLASERKADVVVSIFEGAALPIALLRCAARFRAPIVVWDVGLTESWCLGERVLDRVLPRVDGILVLSASQKAYIEKRWRTRHGVEILGHTIDTEFFVPAPPQPHGTVLSVGEDAGRDFPTLLAAAGDINVKFVVKTTRLPESHPLPSNVSVVSERISHLELRRLYAESSFVVVPLRQTLNASGVSTVLEAAAMGRALVVSDNPAIRDFTIPGETCLTVPCGDSAAMRASITRLLHEPDTCARLGENARRFVERVCAPAMFADRLAALLRRHARGSAARAV